MVVYNLWRNDQADQIVSLASTIIAWIGLAVIGSVFLLDLANWLFYEYKRSNFSEEEEDREKDALQNTDYRAPVVMKMLAKRTNTSV